MIQNEELTHAVQLIADAIRERRSYLIDDQADVSALIDSLTILLFHLTGCISSDELRKHP